MATLVYPAAAPPLAVLAAARLARGVVAQQREDADGARWTSSLVLMSGAELHGDATLLRFIGRESGGGGGELYGGGSPLAAAMVDQWLEHVNGARLIKGPGFTADCAYLDSFLALRTFFVGRRLSLADLVVWACLAETVQWDGLHKSGKMPHLARWFDHVDSIPALKELADQLVPRRKKALEQAVTRAVERATAMAGASGAERSLAAGDAAAPPATAAAAAGQWAGTFDIELPGAEEGKVVTRFPPEPSGYLHIGHVKAALLNDYFARRFKGRLILRFDDTNPSKEKDEYVENIMADLETLGIRHDVLSYTSDHFPELERQAERLIREGKFYVDATDVETMRKQRMDGVASEYRDAPVEQSLGLWREMLAGSERGLQCCVRARLDMQAPNKALRDPVMYRCNLTPHHRTGERYKAYPTYDFACPFVDSVEGVTHALRTSEYKDREDQYYAVIGLLGIRRPHLWDFSRLNFVYTLLSKRKLQWFVDNRVVDGWMDPRFPTLQGMLRRGLQVEALRAFILSQGASKNNNLMEWDKLWTMNKKLVDPVCPRHTAVLADGRVPVTLANGPAEPFYRVLPRHKKFDGAGSKATLYSSALLLDQADAAAVAEGEEVTLMDWGNAIVRSKTVDAATGRVTAIQADLHLEGSVKATKWKLTWLAQSQDLVPVTLVEFGHLITKAKIEEGDDWQALVNPASRLEAAALGDGNMRSLRKGEVLQLERKGYFIVEAPFITPARPMVLFSIPDGRATAAPAAK